MSDSDLEARIRTAYADDGDASPRASFEVVRARRAAGERGDRTRLAPPKPKSRRWAVIGIAAALLLVATLYPMYDMEPRRLANTPPGSAALFLPDPLLGQTTRTPMYPVVDEPLGLRLKPGRWFYRYSMNGAMRSDSLTVNAIERAEYQGRPAWQFLSGRASADGPAISWDTVWTTRDSLRILARVAQMTPSDRLIETYSDSEVLRGETHGGYTAWQSRPLRTPNGPDGNGVSIRWYQFAAALQTARLSADWKASVEFRGVIFENGGTRDYLNVAVVGEERVSLPAGEFDCWKVALGGPTAPGPDAAVTGPADRDGLVFLVSKDRGWLVEQRYRRDGATRLAVQLVRVEELP